MLTDIRVVVQAEFMSWAYAAMALIFAITTPAGVAIGIGIQSTYNADSVTNLIVSGVFDSISTGARSNCCGTHASFVGLSEAAHLRSSIMLSTSETRSAFHI